MVQSRPQTLFIVENQKFARSALIKSPNCVGQRGVLTEGLRRKRIEKRRERFFGKTRFSERQPAPKGARPASDRLEQKVAKRCERTGKLRKQATADLHAAEHPGGTHACFAG